MIKEAIILAGGLGTRLRESVPDLPKCMAPVAGRPFLFHVINYLRSQGVEKFIFSLGYKHELIEDYLSTQFSTLSYQCVIEEEPLGTGGAILLACTKATEKNIVVTNGDTLFKIDLHKATMFHNHNNAECTLLLKPMNRFDRYGVVELDEEQLVNSFKEKQFYETGNINGGVYLLNKDKFLDEEFPAKFSFEKHYLEKFYPVRRIYGLIQDAYFIDIGIPEDYNRAQSELSRPPLDLSTIDKSWTLFIDRDGVINHEKKEDYILNWEEFRFYEGVEKAFQKLAGKFGKIIIVSNQRGVGKQLMTEHDLRTIHQNMQNAIEAAGGRIDKIYYCTSTDNKHPDRKPNPGMAFHAKNYFDSVDLSRSVIIGNKPSDMLFGKNAGIYSVFLATTNPDVPFPHPDIDLRFDSLPDFAKAL
ncbi:MAG TPA: HAD-IIIA family hydrolase [Chitinophagaceae bacterium]|mgnify:CR=1 FL=1|nr:HAD-IIIA family hydrolase [Chitinophagaceae bacterium]HQV86379.1 HAD-IIIA family hydrolase [Chitinophagaceae bacterium]HQZ75333.1 HAD-IIIA family hydrolase [Chitinophagaceae bacterium]